MLRQSEKALSEHGHWPIRSAIGCRWLHSISLFDACKSCPLHYEQQFESNRIESRGLIYSKSVAVIQFCFNGSIVICQIITLQICRRSLALQQSRWCCANSIWQTPNSEVTVSSLARLVQASLAIPAQVSIAGAISAAAISEAEVALVAGNLAVGISAGAATAVVSRAIQSLEVRHQLMSGFQKKSLLIEKESDLTFILSSFRRIQFTPGRRRIRFPCRGRQDQ